MLLADDCALNLGDFDILAGDSNKFKLLIRENLREM